MLSCFFLLLFLCGGTGKDYCVEECFNSIQSKGFQCTFETYSFFLILQWGLGINGVLNGINIQLIDQFLRSQWLQKVSYVMLLTYFHFRFSDITDISKTKELMLQLHITLMFPLLLVCLSQKSCLLCSWWPHQITQWSQVKQFTFTVALIPCQSLSFGPGNIWKIRPGRTWAVREIWPSANQNRVDFIAAVPRAGILNQSVQTTQSSSSPCIEQVG